MLNLRQSHTTRHAYNLEILESVSISTERMHRMLYLLLSLLSGCTQQQQNITSFCLVLPEQFSSITWTKKHSKPLPEAAKPTPFRLPPPRDWGSCCCSAAVAVSYQQWRIKTPTETCYDTGIILPPISIYMQTSLLIGFHYNVKAGSPYECQKNEFFTNNDAQYWNLFINQNRIIMKKKLLFIRDIKTDDGQIIFK